MQAISRFTVIVAAALFCAAMAPGVRAASTAADREAGHVQAVAKSLHDRLKITTAQEEQWGKVVEAMQANAATMEPLVEARTEKEKTMNAVDDLKSYGEITEAHAAGIKNFVAAFEPLYSSMSEDQKKTADRIFMQGVRKHLKKK